MVWINRDGDMLVECRFAVPYEKIVGSIFAAIRFIGQSHNLDNGTSLFESGSQRDFSATNFNLSSGIGVVTNKNWPAVPCNRFKLIKQFAFADFPSGVIRWAFLAPAL